MKVNLFLLGAMKAGTTTLHNLLHRHPDIFMSLEKEPQQFSGNPWCDYDAIFNGASSEVYRGESSTCYSKLPDKVGVAERIYEYNPDAKLIYLTREPIARAISHYKHSVFMSQEEKSVEKSLIEGSPYLEYGHYARQIKEYLKFFPKEQLFVGRFEDLKNDPEGFCNKLVAWLGLSPQGMNFGSLQHDNKSPELVLNHSDSAFWSRLVKALKKMGFLKKSVPTEWKKKLMAWGVIDASADFGSEHFRSAVESKRKELHPLMEEWAREFVELGFYEP